MKTETTTEATGLQKIYEGVVRDVNSMPEHLLAIHHVPTEEYAKKVERTRKFTSRLADRLRRMDLKFENNSMADIVAAASAMLQNYEEDLKSGTLRRFE